MYRLTDLCAKQDAQIKALKKELDVNKSTLGMYVEKADLKEAIGDEGSLKVSSQRRFKCWADNAAKIKELPKEMRMELCVPDYQAIKAKVAEGALPNSILDDALFKDVTTMSFKERK